MGWAAGTPGSPNWVSVLLVRSTEWLASPPRVMTPLPVLMGDRPRPESRIAIAIWLARAFSVELVSTAMTVFPGVVSPS